MVAIFVAPHPVDFNVLPAITSVAHAELTCSRIIILKRTIIRIQTMMTTISTYKDSLPL